MKKKCPNCGGKAVKLYKNKMIDSKRKWVPIGWCCTDCSYIYQIASDTLIYKMGETNDESLLPSQCPKCEKKLVRAYRHKNPKYGKQQWLSVGWFCDRCRYAWIETSSIER